MFLLSALQRSSSTGSVNQMVVAGGGAVGGPAGSRPAVRNAFPHTIGMLIWSAECLCQPKIIGLTMGEKMNAWGMGNRAWTLRVLALIAVVGCAVSVMTLRLGDGHFPFAGQPAATGQNGKALAVQYGCLGCHDESPQQFAPTFAAVARRNYTAAQLVTLIRQPVPTNWSTYVELKMPPMNGIPANDLREIAAWISHL